jgi:hypothetical protein
MWGASKSASRAGFPAAKHFCEPHRPEIPNLDPYIKLAQ